MQEETIQQRFKSACAKGGGVTACLGSGPNKWLWLVGGVLPVDGRKQVRWEQIVCSVSHDQQQRPLQTQPHTHSTETDKVSNAHCKHSHTHTHRQTQPHAHTQTGSVTPTANAHRQGQ